MYFLIDKEEKGISLIETIVSLVIISMVSVGFLSGMATNYRGKLVQDEEAIGEAVSSSQIEYLKTQPFSDNEYSYNVSTSSRNYVQQPSWWDENNPPLLDPEYNGYYSLVSVQDFDADGDSIIEIPGDDDSVRQIIVDVYNPQDILVIHLTGYKTDR